MRLPVRASLGYFAPELRILRCKRSGGTESAPAAARAIVSSQGTARVCSRAYSATTRWPSYQSTAALTSGMSRSYNRKAPIPWRSNRGCSLRKFFRTRFASIRACSSSFTAGGPALHLVQDRARSVLLQVVTGALQEVRAVGAGEELLPALQLRLAEGAVLERPTDQRRLLPQPGEVVLDPSHAPVRLVERVLRLRDELREAGDPHAVVRGREGRAIGVELRLRQMARPALRQEQLDEEIRLRAALPAAAAEHQELEQPGQLQARLSHERPAIEHDDPGDPLRMLRRPGHADGAAPVLDHRNHAGRLQLAQHAPEVVDVAIERVPARIPRLVAAAEPDVVGRDHAVSRREAGGEHPGQGTPSGTSRQQQERPRRR